MIRIIKFKQATRYQNLIGKFFLFVKSQHIFVHPFLTLEIILNFLKQQNN